MEEKKMTMNLLLVVKVVTLCLMVVAPATSDIIFDLNTPQNYETFVAQVRNKVRDEKRSYFGLPIIKAPSATEKYLYIQINAPPRKNGGGEDLPAISVTLQLKTADLYLVAYHDKNRGFYFRGLIAKKEVFPNVSLQSRQEIDFDHDYRSIVGAARKQIKDLVFRLPNLEDAMRIAYNKKTGQGDFKQAQALFLLYSIEMTAEAARFKYIELKTVKQLPSDVEVASLVTKWGKLSEQIVRSKNGTFETPIEIQVAETKIWTVKNVNEIKPDIGILKYVNEINPDIGILSYIKPKIADT